MKIRLPTLLAALLLLTTPCYAGKWRGLFIEDDFGRVINDDSGIATKANSGYRVVARVADNIIKVLFR